ncbi:hypothetical protein BAE44_0015866, partial [Dichanthelium oligosanthes]
LAIPPTVTDDTNSGVLPTDVLYDILLRLPAKELCRLRLICRAWRALISDPGYARAHQSRDPLFARLLFSFAREELQIVNL